MDYLGEAIALGVDAIIFGACMKQYLKNKNAMSMIQGAPYLDIDKDLKEIVQTHPDQKLSYVSIRGMVKPMGNPIVSSNNPKVSGVVQLLRIREHVIQRSTAGFWSDHERLIQEVHNVMPFVLDSNGYTVEIVDPVAADILDMDVISDVFTPTVPSVMDHIWGFFAGVRQRGVQTTEKMLRKGTMITGIGELVASKDGSTLKLQPPTNEAPFYLTNMQITSLVRKLDDTKKTYRWLCLLFGTVGLVLGGLMARRFYKDYCKKRDDLRTREELERNRVERRRRVRDDDLPEIHLCVVCRINPREIILLPCGHVCLCEDCSTGIVDNCPVCRSAIDKKSAAYIS
ncbi:PREDICTED: mitochondrial ubiquitin ligase activator of nfkb 1 [Nicrophorus vespilloides]|uniref:RING-type E3 ubiquitin transferase n=1 Tax=Nicrophorus vespilloides TaxID=110193 RepID=A0ABM1MIB3_NICVS|nr:PREDICTED: mitochondrial ubiquitin ligase activator of nfkb 1 [Nicrophorus vespilloides]